MNENELKFELYRYQLNPIKTDQLELFGEDISYDELKARKNNLFEAQILNKETEVIAEKGEYIKVRIFHMDHFIGFKFASKKILRHFDSSLQDKELDDYPFVYVLVNNDPSKQVIAISKNYKAFNNTETVANILERTYSRKLQPSQLSFSVAPILDKKEYWSVLNRYNGRITQIRFDIIKPNITNISKKIKEGLRGLSESTNSLKTRVELNAPENQTLEDITKDNENISALSDYSTAGGGDVSLKVKGIKRRVQTKTTIREQSISEASLSGDPQFVLDAIKQLTGD